LGNWLKLWVPVIIVSLIISITLASSVDAQGKYSIPAWVKGVAGFWAEDKITDDEFGEGLSFLIEEDIIKVPKIESLKQQVIQLESKVNQLEQENTQLQNQQKSSSSNLDIIAEKKSSVGMTEYCKALKDWNVEYQGVEWLTAETTNEYNKLCVTKSSTSSSTSKILNEDKTLGPEWHSGLAKFLPFPEDLTGTWKLGGKNSYIEDPKKGEGSKPVNSNIESFSKVSYIYYAPKHKISVVLQDFESVSPDEVLESQKEWDVKYSGGRLIASDELNGNCYANHRETGLGNYVDIYCSKTNLGIVVDGFGPKFDSTKKYAFSIANIILNKL